MNASSFADQQAIIIALVKPHQALKAYVSLAITTDRFDILSVDRYRPCNEHAVFLKAYRVWAHELLNYCVYMCSAIGRLLVS